MVLGSFLEEQVIGAGAAFPASEVYRAVLNAAPDAFLVIDRSGSILFMNARGRELFGYAEEDLATLNIEDLLPEDLREVHRELRSSYHTEPHVRRMGSGFDFTAQCKDGSTLYLEISLSPIRMGEMEAVVAVARDVSDRRRIRREIERAAAMITSSNQPFVGLTLEGEVISWNAAAELLYGYAADEVLGRGVESFAGREGVELIVRQIAALRTGLREEAHEVHHRRKDGSPLLVRMLLSPVYDAPGMLIGASLLIQDVSAQRRAEQDLSRIDADTQWHVAQALHEDLAQQIAGVALLAGVHGRQAAELAPELAGAFERMGALLNNALKRATELAKRLTPVDRQIDGLYVALEMLANHITEVRGVTCTFEAGRLVPVRDPNVSTNLYRFAETLLNELLRAKTPPRSVRVALAPAGEQVLLSFYPSGGATPYLPQGELERFRRLAARFGAVVSFTILNGTSSVIECRFQPTPL